MCYHIPTAAYTVDIKIFLIILLKEGRDYGNFKSHTKSNFAVLLYTSFLSFPLYSLSSHFGKYDLKIY